MKFHEIREIILATLPWTDFLKPLSVTNNSVGSRTAAASKVGAAVVAHLAGSGRSRTDAVICGWKGLNFYVTT